MRGKVAEKRERCTNVMSAKSYSARGIGAHTIFGSSILTRRPMKLNADIAKRNTVQRPISEHTYQRSTWRNLFLYDNESPFFFLPLKTPI